MWKIRHGSLNKHPKLSLTGNVPRLIVIQDTLHWLHKFSLLIESELLRDRCCSLWSRRPESALDACCADALPPCSLCRQADESCAVSGAGDARDWWGPGGNEVWMWKSVGPTAPWPRADGRRSGGTPTPLRTTRSVGCPRRSPTAPARPWKRLITIPPGCSTGTESRIWFTAKRMSTADKVGPCLGKQGLLEGCSSYISPSRWRDDFLGLMSCPLTLIWRQEVITSCSTLEVEDHLRAQWAEMQVPQLHILYVGSVTLCMGQVRVHELDTRPPGLLTVSWGCSHTWCLQSELVQGDQELLVPEASLSCIRTGNSYSGSPGDPFRPAVGVCVFTQEPAWRGSTCSLAGYLAPEGYTLTQPSFP